MFTVDEIKVLDAAASIIKSKIKTRDVLNNPEITKQFLQYKMAYLEHEVFGVIFLNTQHEVIEYKELFRGTLDSASVYPREVVKETLNYNAAAVIFAHNHPSGVAEPSEADRRITERLQSALRFIDVSVLDHIVIGLSETVSFAKRGWL
ncbi:RadC family protein [Shewanella frigidimarina]|uniref:RadC family protein n=1 Tax=Shewanella frigidimarina TaxID=56812 RepID=UPI003D7BCFBB